MNTNSGLRRGTILALSIVVLMISSGLVVAQDAPVDGAPDKAPGEEIDYTQETIVVEQDLENGEIRLNLGEAKMLVNFGDGRVSFATIQTKYLGIADVYNDRKGFDKRVGIPVETIFWQRLIGVAEYTDGNNNGMFDVHGPKVAGTLEELGDAHVSHEGLLKWVDYGEVEWTLSQWQQQQNGNEVDITFVISSSDIPYDSDNGSITNETVANIAYIFHVSTYEEEISVQAVPHYRVNANENGELGNQIDDSREVARPNVTGHILNSTWKYDQVIEGWDVATDSVGADRNDTRLVVLTEMAYGIHMSSAVGEWIHEEFGQLPPPRAFAGNVPREINEDNQAPDNDNRGHPLRCGVAYVQSSDSVTGAGSTDTTPNDKTDEERKKEKVQERIHEYTDTACKQRGDSMVADNESRPEVIRAGGIHFEDNGANLGRIRWVSNATVDGLETEVLFQLHGARPVLAIDVGGKDGIWAGVRMVGGYNYVLGTSVYHDPEYSADVLTVDIQSFGEPFVYGNGDDFFRKLLTRLIHMMPLAFGIVVLATVAIAVASTRSRREQAPIPSQQQYVPAGAWTTDDDWSQYQT